jgi:predicted metal-binding membrane protein
VQAVKYQLDVALVSTWVFVGAYLLVWAFAGIAAYAVSEAMKSGSVAPSFSW